MQFYRFIRRKITNKIHYLSGSREFPLLSPILFPCSFFTPKIYAIILSIFFFAMNSFLNKKAFQYDAYHSLFTVQGCLCQGGLPDRDLLDMGPGTEIPLPRKNMGPGSQTGSGIIQRPPMNRHIPVKILPCPKLLLQAVKIFLGVGIPERWGSLCQDKLEIRQCHYPPKKKQRHSTHDIKL